MNVFRGVIKEIEVHNGMSLIRVAVNDVRLSTIVIDTPSSKDYLQLGNLVNVIFKETEVIIGIGTGLSVSLRNQFVGPVMHIDKGQLLSKVRVSTSIGDVTSIITTKAVETLPINLNDIVTAMIKTNEVMLAP